MMKQAQTKQSGVPVAIIGLVMVLAVFMSWWYYNSTKTDGTTKSGTRPATSPTPVNVANAPLGAQPPNMLGSPTATVTVEEFADFQCPACADKHPILKEIQSIYGSRIKFVFRHFPLQMHEKAYDAAVAAEAAGIQGKFWDMQNQLYTNQKAWSSDPNYKQVFKSYAEKIGLDIAKYETDAAGIQTKGRVDEDVRRGRALNVNSTPTIYINGKSVPYDQMSVQSLRQLIDTELQSANSTSGLNKSTANPANSNSK